MEMTGGSLDGLTPPFPSRFVKAPVNMKRKQVGGASGRRTLGNNSPVCTAAGRVLSCRLVRSSNVTGKVLSPTHHLAQCPERAPCPSTPTLAPFSLPHFPECAERGVLLSPLLVDRSSGGGRHRNPCRC
jgi:hypothetical protein